MPSAGCFEHVYKTFPLAPAMSYWSVLLMVTTFPTSSIDRFHPKNCPHQALLCCQLRNASRASDAPSSRCAPRDQQQAARRTIQAESSRVLPRLGRLGDLSWQVVDPPAELFPRSRVRRRVFRKTGLHSVHSVWTLMQFFIWRKHQGGID